MVPTSKLRIIPLGGVGEFGKNITVFEYEDDILVVDCGSIFPQEDMLGIDLVIPDVTYLLDNQERVRAFLLTHGHEDHIGALPYVLSQINVPIYGSKLTLALVENKLKEHGVKGAQMKVVRARDGVRIGTSFSVQFIKVNHSISGALALAITCPVGTVIVTGDFKVDYTPIDGEVTDLNTLAAWGSHGVLALLCDSSNAGVPGYTMSERKVGETFHNLFQTATGRIIIAMFSSNIHRIQQVVDASTRFGRRICFYGRSMVNVSKMAMQYGELKVPEGRLISAEVLEHYNDDQIVILTTGSQGEPMAGLTRMAYNENKRMSIRESDMVILSARSIPGNELLVSRVLNQLYRCGAQVIYEDIADVHTSGHARQEEIKLMITLTKPRFYIPVHGEYRQLWQNAQLAEALGYKSANVVIPEMGQVLELGEDTLHIAGGVTTGSVMVDGLGIGDVGNVVLRDRKHLSQDGLIIVVMGVNAGDGKISSGPDIISRGFVYTRDNEALIDSIKEMVVTIMEDYDHIEPGDWQTIKSRIKDELHTHLYGQLKRNPMIIPIIVET